MAESGSFLNPRVGEPSRRAFLAAERRLNETQAALATDITDHSADADPHPQYLKLTGGTLTGGLSGFTLANGISGTNFNITGVNQIEIADPGEGIAWTNGANGTKTLYVIDDATDDILYWDGSQFRANTLYGSTSVTAPDVYATTRVLTNSIRNTNGNFLALEAGDGWSLDTNASGEYVWLAAEGGIIIVSSDNNSTDWTAREQIRITAEGGVDTMLRVHGQLRTNITGDYGTIQTANVNAWDGFSINGRVVFMHDDGSAWGIYNDVNNEWMVYGQLNGGVELRYNNSTKLTATSDGADVVGIMWADAFREKETGANLDRCGANYGSWNIDNYTRGSYYGIALNNAANFMYATSAMGIYNDIENEWIMYGDRNSESYMFYNGGVRVTCRSDGVTNAGRIITDGIAYNHGNCGGSANSIAFRWVNPYGKMSIDNVICATAATFSDRRIKTDITSWNDGLGMIRQLRPVTYRPRDIIGFGEITGSPIEGVEVRDETLIGLIAQEVAEVIPSAVTGDPDGSELMSILEDQMIAVIISAVQNIDTRLQALETV